MDLHHENILHSDLITDGFVELRLIRILGPNDDALRCNSAQFLCGVPELRFAIHRRCDGVRVGRIHLRVTTDVRITSILGHTGYEVEPEHRRRGYASHALRIISRQASHYEILPVWVFIEPENMASRKTAERAGFRLVDIVDTKPEAVALGVGPHVCRYILEYL